MAGGSVTAGAVAEGRAAQRAAEAGAVAERAAAQGTRVAGVPGEAGAAGSADSRVNNVRPEDCAVHGWYRFVLSFPPHLVQDYLERFGVAPAATVLDPFAGTGTTLVECKRRAIGSVGLEPNPMAQFAASVKLDWSADPTALAEYAATVATGARRASAQGGWSEWSELPLFADSEPARAPLRGLSPAQTKQLVGATGVTGQYPRRDRGLVAHCAKVADHRAHWPAPSDRSGAVDHPRGCRWRRADVVAIDLFRTRLSTATGAHLREEVVVLEWPT